MLECLILGDSIGVGVAQHRPECVVKATVGINSRVWNQTHPDQHMASTVIISLGSNDYRELKTLDELIKIRNRITADKVFWIVPVNSKIAREAVEAVVYKFKDRLITINNVSKDGIHPTTYGYKQLAEKTR
jgi:hypothetical protein